MLVAGKRQRLHGFDESGQHGERGADFMGDVGDEVAPHRLGLLEDGDVLRDQEHAALPVRAEPHGQARGAGGGGAGRAGQDDGVVEIPRDEVGDEGGVAQQMRDRLGDVAPGVEAEVPAGRLVAPFDAGLSVEDDDAVWRGLQAVLEVLEAAFALPHQAGLLAQQAGYAIDRFAPHAGQAVRRRVRFFVQPAQPGQEAQEAPGVPGQPEAGAQRDAEAHAGDRVFEQAGDARARAHEEQQDSQAGRQAGHGVSRNASSSGGIPRRARSRSCRCLLSGLRAGA